MSRIAAILIVVFLSMGLIAVAKAGNNDPVQTAKQLVQAAYAHDAKSFCALLNKRKPDCVSQVRSKLSGKASRPPIVAAIGGKVDKAHVIVVWATKDRSAGGCVYLVHLKQGWLVDYADDCTAANSVAPAPKAKRSRTA